MVSNLLKPFFMVNNETNMKQPNITILHGVNCVNAGDLGIIHSTVQRVRDVFPEAEINILSPFKNFYGIFHHYLVLAMLNNLTPLTCLNVAPSLMQRSTISSSITFTPEMTSIEWSNITSDIGVVGPSMILKASFLQ